MFIVLVGGCRVQVLKDDPQKALKPEEAQLHGAFHAVPLLRVFLSSAALILRCCAKHWRVLLQARGGGTRQWRQRRRREC